MTLFIKLIKINIFAIVFLGLTIAMGVIASYLYVWPTLPSIDELRDYKLQTPMSVFSKDGQLIAEFGEKKRLPVTIEEIPKKFVQALLATEDQRFYEHSGVDFVAMARILKVALLTGKASQGGSTLTMLVSRNYFLDRSRKITRKVTEMFLSWKIEAHVTKDEILEMLLNKIPFGHRTFGLGAAAQLYYGKKLNELSLPQLAVLAGIPKGQSKYNPISRPDLATKRRNHVLNRMLVEKYISEEEYAQAKDSPITAYYHGPRISFAAEYFAEMVRRQVVNMYGTDFAYTSGLNVYTTLQSKAQLEARYGVRKAIVDYDKRHKYRGPELSIDSIQPDKKDDYIAMLSNMQDIGQLQPALVFNVKESQADILLKNGDSFSLTEQDLNWAQYNTRVQNKADDMLDETRSLQIGDVVRVYYESGQWHLAQIPEISAAFVALDPSDGAIIALEGGFDFDVKKFNNITQARRQPGSNIKPLIYSAALENGFTAASLVNDAPTAFVDKSTNRVWRPKNSGERYRGLIRLREALKWSINSISVRLMGRMGMDTTITYLKRFGFTDIELPRFRSMALGAIDITPLQVAASYAVFANGGFKVDPYFIERVEDMQGELLFEAKPSIACEACAQIEAESHVQKQLSAELAGYSSDEMQVFKLDPERPIFREPMLPVPENQLAPRIIESRNAFIINSMMQDVITAGTGFGTLYRAKSPLLKRNDLAGKTGTTNDAKDTWFSGFNKKIVGTAWVGFDDHRKVGDRESGAKTALPIWSHFMEKMLEGVPNEPFRQPPGLISVRIDPKTGLLPTSSDQRTIFEIFREEFVPKKSTKPTFIDPTDDLIDDDPIF
jgi:penicillin-binding protein 1A